MTTLYEALVEAGIPVASATLEDGVRLIPGTNLTAEQSLLQGEIVMQYQSPEGYAEYLAYKQLTQQIKDEYQNMITRLEQIQTATNPTNAQVIQAIKDEALYIERIMKFLKRLLT